MEIIVGRKGEQPFAITDKSVSGKHLKLTALPDGKVQVEDLGSTNGTFIDGVRIIKKVVSRNTIVQMGSSYQFRISDVLPEVASKPVPVNTPSTASVSQQPKEQVLTAEEQRTFKNLEKIYEDYHAALVALQKDNAQKGFMRMLPMSVVGIAGVLVSLVPGLEAYRALIICLGVGASIILMWKAYNTSTDLPEKMERLRRQFQIDYVCPKCKNFLGDIPFEGIKNKCKCSFCKTKWE